ncbi:unnamed protein product [Leptosia nina]|uniref:Uncharacterized protein n=1 Tax=Leptosia nina TaxID=320188 RepID=A0AAV1JPJ3_9NEOP
MTLCLFAAILSTIACIAVSVTWCLIPKWRTLHNFISLHQIIIGTLHLYSMTINTIFFADRSMLFIDINGYLFLTTLSWTFCASTLAYLRLGLVYMMKISFEKRKAALFAYGTTIVCKIVTDIIVPNIFPLKSLFLIGLPRMLTVYIILGANFFLFVCVTKSVIKSTSNLSRARGNRIVALVGVAILSDIAIHTYTTSLLIHPLLSMVLSPVLYLRLIPQALVVLFNRRSREQWTDYLNKRKRSTNRAMELQIRV